MNAKNSSHLILIGGLTILLITLVLFGVLAFSAVYKEYRYLGISVQALACENFTNTLSRTTRLGIEPNRLNDLPILIENLSKNLHTKSILVLNADYDIVVNWNYEGKTITIPSILKEEYNNVKSFTNNKTLWLIDSILDREDNVKGYGLLGIDKNIFLDNLEKLTTPNALLFGGISLFSCILFILLYLMLIKSHHNITSGQLKLRIYLILFVPLIFAQCIFSFMLYEPLRTAKESNMQEMVVQIANQIGQEVQYVLDLGLTLEQIQKPTATHLMDFQKKLSWVSGIKITKDGYYLATSQEKNISDAEWDSMSSTAILWDTAIYKPQIEKGLNIDVLISSDVVTESLMSILWETLTIIVVCFIFMTEVLVFLTLKEEQARLTNTIPFTSRAEFIRPVMFICMFSISLCISFIPLHMREISTGFLGLQDNIVMGIPVSCEFFMMGFSTMICGTIIPKIGWRLPLLWGIGILAFSNIMSGLINDPWVFLVARSLAGIGYGMLSLSAQVFVVSHSSSISKGRNFAFMISGIMAGVVCGSAFGGLIADRLGYGMGFIVTGIYLLMTVIVLLLVLKKEPWVPVEAEKQRMSLRDLKDFLLNTRIFTFLLLGIFPCAFVYIGLIRFYIPILIDTAGGSATTIGRINMFYCLVSMYLSPVFARLIDNSRNKVLWVSGAILICAASVAVLLLSDGIWIVMISVFLIGIVQAIRAGARGSYSLEIPSVTRFGSTRAMITFKFMNLIGQALGPITLGLLIALWGEVISFTVLAIVLVLMSLVFLAVNIPKSIKSQE